MAHYHCLCYTFGEVGISQKYTFLHFQARLFSFTKNANKMVIKVIRKACNEGVKACWFERVIKMPLTRLNGGGCPTYNHGCGLCEKEISRVPSVLSCIPLRKLQSEAATYREDFVKCFSCASLVSMAGAIQPLQLSENELPPQSVPGFRVKEGLSCVFSAKQ